MNKWFFEPNPYIICCNKVIFLGMPQIRPMIGYRTKSLAGYKRCINDHCAVRIMQHHFIGITKSLSNIQTPVVNSRSFHASLIYPAIPWL